MRRRPSIRAQLAILLAMLLVPSLGALGLSQYRLFQRDLRETENDLLRVAEAASIGIGEFLSSSERVLARLAEDPDLRALDPSRCPAYLSALARIYIPTYTNLFIWNQEGEGICSLAGANEDRSSVGTPPGLEAIKAAQGFNIGPVHQGTVSGRWTAGLSYPIRDDGGEKRGNITLSVDLLRFQEILDGLRLRGDELVSVTERGTGTIVARSRDSERTVGSRAPPPSGTTELTPDVAPRGIQRARALGGEDHIWGFVEITGTPWVVYAGKPVAAVYTSLYGRWIRSGLLALATLLLIILLGWLVHLRVTRPLEELAQEVARAKPGDPAPLTVQGAREVAHLATRFNQAWEAWAEAEEALRRSSARVRSLVENAVTAIYVSTESGRFLDVNQAMVDLLGYQTREELLGTSVSELYGSRERRGEVLSRVGRQETFKGTEMSWLRKDGGEVKVRLFGRRLQTPAGETAWEVIAEDVTQIRNLQEQYLQAQKMEALGRMAGGIAHDFNNLLTVVQGQAELLMEDPRVGEDLKSQIAEISEAASRGATLNQQLLAFGRRGLEVQNTLDLNRILNAFQVVLRRAVGEEIRLQFSLSPELAPIHGNRGQVEQVVMNLVVNAKDAMPRGGDLLLETYGAMLDQEDAASNPLAQAGPHVVLAVTDTGTGMEPKVLANIFEPFFSTKSESKGTGLGLSTVYGIVTEMGGHIRVESEADRGTTFHLFFPQASHAETAAEEGTSVKIPGNGSGLILLAEDEDAVRRLTTRILERAGYEVLAARDGKEALETARAHQGTIDLLLSDVVMPGLRGPELAEAMAREGLVERAVLFSGYPEGLKEKGLRGLKAWELIPKPFNSSDLLGAVERALGFGG